MALQKYFSGFSVFDYIFYGPPPFYGKGWNIIFEKMDNLNKNGSLAIINGTQYPTKNVIINANSLERAKYVTELLFAAKCLYMGELSLFHQMPVTLQINTSDTFQQKSLIGESCNGVPVICMIAAKASYRKEYQYALFKHLTSLELISSDSIVFDPSEWTPGKYVSLSIDYRVKCAYAIVIAYSVIEELSLEPRASEKSPSYIDGKWNPIVKNELEGRLVKAGINLEETFPWILRDTPTKLERVRKPRIKSKANWAFGKIRDGEIEVIDALTRASWLRSKVSAHKLRELASSLNYYEVNNVQRLARRLLLEKMGFWKYEDNESVIT